MFILPLSMAKTSPPLFRRGNLTSPAPTSCFVAPLPVISDRLLIIEKQSKFHFTPRRTSLLMSAVFPTSVLHQYI